MREQKNKSSFVRPKLIKNYRVIDQPKTQSTSIERQLAVAPKMVVPPYPVFKIPKSLKIRKIKKRSDIIAVSKNIKQ